MERSDEPSISSSFAAPLPLSHVEMQSETICQVLSPHPSFKLLLLSTTVMVHNSSGMPLEICFLDADLNPLLLPAASGASAPADAVGGPSAQTASKEGHLSAEPPCSLHPDLEVVPQWMLEREQRWREAQQQEIMQQKEQMRLLLLDAAAPVAAAPSKRWGKLALRRAQTEALSGRGVSHSPRSRRTPSVWHPQEAAAATRQETLALRPLTPKEQIDRLTYTFLLPNQHVLSVPQRAILGNGWCNADPLILPPDMSCIAGWCDLIDTRQRMEGLRCRQSAYLPPSCRRGTVSSAAQVEAQKEGAAAFAAAALQTVRNLYFLVHIEGRKGALPAEKELKRVTIFPSLTLVNATMTELDINIAPSSTSDGKASRKQLMAVADVPPNRPLRFRMRFAMLEGAEWSSVISDLLSTQVPLSVFLLHAQLLRLQHQQQGSLISSHDVAFCPAQQDEVVSRLLLPSRHLASVELEVLHDTAEVLPFLSYIISPKQLVAVIAAPRAFIDRTGLGIRPVHEGRFFPEFDGQSLLGDSTTSDVTLLLPRRRSHGQPVECRVTLPALGGHSHAALQTEDRCYTLRLKTEKMTPSETAGMKGFSLSEKTHEA
ncbi:hypothetical protein cyc_08466 [Cyclospora cayetanensis]|uniref:Uncharacterized protein n=1 Tax=Cyclospora cayetanensis TaxID=88456 RepID=A0A1D3D977_9EIME|nr:hypothetical protein cyc_08466 [Cyclospora cayetanensis]